MFKFCLTKKGDIWRRVLPALWGLVKFHIGGKVREPKGRMGEIPIPTVIVRMRKDKS